MALTKESALARVNTRSIGQFLSLATVATILPFFIHLQWITGPIVNAILILALFLVGIRSALVLCLVPSLLALAGGLLPVMLAPMVPFIMIGNVIFVLAIEWVYNRAKNEQNGYFVGIFLGGLIKFLFLYFSAGFIGALLAKSELTIKVAQMLSWPQFFTAISGGFIAWIILKWLKRI